MSRDWYSSAGVLAAVLASTWGAWDWYVTRIWSTPEEGLALVLALLLVAGLFWQRPCVSRVPLGSAAVLLLVYAALAHVAPPIIATAAAVMAVMWTAYRSLLGTSPPFAFYGLVACALPVLPSLQFVLGYPLRLVSAGLTVGLLKLQGFSVEREGTHLLWAGERVQFDAPCSGVNMLWAGVFLTLIACTVWRTSAVQTSLALVLSIALTVVANVIRAASLFYIEAGIVTGAAPWWHETVGLSAFAVSAALTISLLKKLNAWEAAR